MTEEEILAIVEELEAYGNKGPSVRRKTCLKAAELIKEKYGQERNT